MAVGSGSPLSLGDLIVKVRGDLKELQSQLATEAPRAAAKSGDAAGKSFMGRFKAQMSAGNLGKGLMQGLGLGAGLGVANAVASSVNAVTDAIGGAFDAAAKFEDRLDTINTIAHLTDEELAALGEGVQAMAIKFGKGTDDLTTGFYDLVSAGIDSADAMGVLEDAAVLSIGALSTTAQAVDLLTTAINAFGLEASDSTRLADIFAQAVADGKVTADQIASSLATVAPLAHEAGVSVEEVAAAYAVMTANGVDAGEVTQNLRQAITALMTPNTALNKIQERTGINFAALMKARGVGAALEALRQATADNAGEMQAALGRVQAYQVALLITGENADEFAESTERMTEAGVNGGVALGQMGERADGAAFKQRRLNAAVEVLNQRLGDFMLGPGGDFMEWLANVISGSPAVEGRLAEVYKAIGLTEQAIADAGKTAAQVDDNRDHFMDWINPHEREFDLWLDQWEGLGQTLGLTRQEMRKMAEDAKIAAQNAGDLRPTVEVLQDLGQSLLTMSTAEKDAAAAQAGRVSSLAAYFGAYAEGADDVEAAGDALAGLDGKLPDLAGPVGDWFAGTVGGVEDAIDGIIDALDIVANTSLKEVRDSAKETRQAINQAFRQPIPTIRALRREEQQLASQRRRAMRQGRFDIVAMIDARAGEVRQQIEAQRTTADLYRAERRATNARKQGLREIQTELGVTRAQAAKVYDAYNGDVATAIARTKELGGIDPAITVTTPGLDEAIARVRSLGLMAGAVPDVSVPTGGGGGRRKGKGRQRALGGDVVADQLYEVLERDQREWFAPAMSGRIYTEGHMRAGLAPAAPGGRAPLTIPLTIQGLPMRARTAVDVIHQVRRAGQMGVLIADPPEQFAEP